MSRDPGEDLLQAMAALAREEAEDELADARWEEMVAGATIDDEERAATALDVDARDEREDARRVFEPLGPAAEDRFVQAALAQIAVKAGQSTPAAPNVVSLDEARARRRSPLWGLLAAVAAAAVVAFVFFRHEAPTYASLPAFDLSLRGGDKAVRSADEVAVLALPRGARVTATLRPASPVVGPVETAIYLAAGERLRRLEAAAETSPDGAVKATIEVPADAPIGEAEIVVVLARPGSLPGDAEGLSSLGSVGAERRVVLRRQARIGEAP